MKNKVKTLLCSLVLAAAGCISSFKETIKEQKIFAREDYLEKIVKEDRQMCYEGRINLTSLEIPRIGNNERYVCVTAFCDFNSSKPDFIKLSSLKEKIWKNCNTYIEFYDLNHNGIIEDNDFIVYQLCSHFTKQLPNGIVMNAINQTKFERFILSNNLYQEDNTVYLDKDPFDIFNIPTDTIDAFKKSGIVGYPYYTDKGELIFLYQDDTIHANGLDYKKDENKLETGKNVFINLKTQYEKQVFPKIFQLIKELQASYPY